LSPLKQMNSKWRTQWYQWCLVGYVPLTNSY